MAVILKGYPRLSETFVAQEILGLERRGSRLEIWSLRRPTDRHLHPMHREIAAPVRYLPEYLHREPWRVLLGLAAAWRRPGRGRLARVFWRDLVRDRSANRLRRLGQALVLARELPEAVDHLYAHFLHTPASVARYAALLTKRSWSFSAHAKDIWTIPDWEKREKLRDAGWGVTCTAEGHAHLAALAPEPARVRLLYHGLDLGRFPAPPEVRPSRTGSDPADPVRIVSVGRLVEKKGFDDLVAALAALPADLHWRCAIAGGGPLIGALRGQAAAAGLGARIAFIGAKGQPEIVALLREADLFVLPAKAARDGDRDGLPNVLMEAASQRLAIVATAFAAIPEFLRPGQDGELVPPGRWDGLANAINLLLRDPGRREMLGRSAYGRLVESFTAEAGLDWLHARLAAGAASPEPEADRPSSAA